MATTPRSLRTPQHVTRDAYAELFSPASTLRSTFEADAHEQPQQPPQQSTHLLMQQQQQRK